MVLSSCQLYIVKVADTTADTTQGATPRDAWQPPAKKSAYLSGLCNTRQRLETGVGGLWLRRAWVRVPSVTLSHRLVRTGLACSAQGCHTPPGTWANTEPKESCAAIVPS